MVQFSETTTIFNAPLPILALSHSLRFPSPYSPHILSADVISREFVYPNQIHTTRLLLKSGKMPKWAPGAVARIGTSWVLEEIVVDMEGNEKGEKNLRTRSRNIDHKSVMEVSEWQSFTVFEGDDSLTKAVTVTRVTSEFTFWPIRHRIEMFGIQRVPKASEKARAGLTLVASLLLDPLSSQTLLKAGPLNPYPFSKTPQSLLAASSELMRAKFEMAKRAATTSKSTTGSMKNTGLGMNAEGEVDEPGRIWRMRWRIAVGRGVDRFRERICKVTGLLCEASEEGCSPGEEGS